MKQEPVYDKTALNAFVQGLYDAKMREGKHGHYETLFHCVHQAIKRVAPTASPVQEPVAWGVFEGNLHDMFFTQKDAEDMARLKGNHAEVKPLYTTSPAAPVQEECVVCGDKVRGIPRPWVGLTEEEVKHAPHHVVDGAYHYSFKQGAEWADRWLREKNGGQA